MLVTMLSVLCMYRSLGFLSKEFVVVKDGLLLEDNCQSQVWVLFWTTWIESLCSVVACGDDFNLKRKE